MQKYTYGPRSGGNPQQIVMLLHGLGSNGMDLLGLAPFYAEYLPDALFISPDAPFPCDMAPMGYQWFSLQDRERVNILEGIHRAAPLLEGFMDAELKRHGLPAEKLALMGFSQGTMMSLYVGPRYAHRIAGILGYSGALYWDEPVKKENFCDIPVYLVHGDADMVVPVSAYHAAMNALKAAGFTDIGGRVFPGLPHTISEEGVKEGGLFLKRIFKS